MTKSNELCFNFFLGYVGGVLELRKLNYSDIKGQFDVKKANFRGQIAKIGYYWTIWLLEPTYGPFTWTMSWELCPKACWRDSRAQKI